MLRALTCLAAFALLAGGPSVAADGHWQPPGIGPTAVTLATVLAARDRAAGVPAAEYARRVEHWTLRVGSEQLRTMVTVREADLRFETPLDGATYAQGRAGGIRWRQTPNGLVRRVGADVQGDDLDRWPLALFPYAAEDCRLLGETDAAPRRYVVEYRPEHDSPHWFFFDAASGQLTNEIEREGSRNVAFAFSDFRRADGVLRPFAWTVRGAGGDADVAVEGIANADVAASLVDLPKSRSDLLASFEGDSVVVPAEFERRSFVAGSATFDYIRIWIDGTVNGRRGRFIFDTGTAQVIVDAAAAQRYGIDTTLGHGIARDLATGPVRFKNIAVETVPLGGYGADGILGYDYFAGHIVHLDYAHDRVSFDAPATFTPPSNARAFSLDYTEGMPLAAARIGTLRAQRFALDTGSTRIVLLRYLLEHHATSAAQLGIEPRGNAGMPAYLEGAITVRNAIVLDIGFAGDRFRGSSVQFEEPSSADAVDFPIDGIFGTDLMSRYEWWFDYDEGLVWLRPA